MDKKLFAKKNYLQAILDNTDLVIYLKDGEGTYLFVNRQYELLAHVSREFIVGKNDYDLFPSDIADLFRSQDEDVKSKKISIEFEETVSLPGGVVTFITSKFPLIDNTGKVYAVGGVVQTLPAGSKNRKRLCLQNGNNLQ